MKILYTFKTKDKKGDVEIYRFASGYYARLLHDGFVIADTAGRSWTNGCDYQVALGDAYKFINIGK